MSASDDLKKLRLRAGLSLERLAKASGFARASSLQRYEDTNYMKGRKLPVEVVAKISPSIVGRGDPAITKEEIWRLAERESRSLAMVTIAAALIPVFPWGRFGKAADMALSEPRLDSLEVAGLAAGNYAAAEVIDDDCEMIAPKGSFVVIDLDDQELRDGRRYMIILKSEPHIRRYHSNPERWESERSRPEATIFPREAISVIGRCVRVIKEL